MEKKTPPDSQPNNSRGTTRPHVKKQQQEKKDKLASALRDNLRRRKFAAIDNDNGKEGKGE